MFEDVILQVTIQLNIDDDQLWQCFNIVGSLPRYNGRYGRGRRVGNVTSRRNFKNYDEHVDVHEGRQHGGRGRNTATLNRAGNTRVASMGGVTKNLQSDLEQINSKM
eukprot:Gb_27574 [translate_table: standard]